VAFKESRLARLVFEGGVSYLQPGDPTAVKGLTRLDDDFAREF